MLTDFLLCTALVCIAQKCILLFLCWPLSSWFKQKKKWHKHTWIYTSFRIFKMQPQIYKYMEQHYMHCISYRQYKRISFRFVSSQQSFVVWTIFTSNNILKKINILVSNHEIVKFSLSFFFSINFTCSFCTRTKWAAVKTESKNLVLFARRMWIQHTYILRITII